MYMYMYHTLICKSTTDYVRWMHSLSPLIKKNHVVDFILAVTTQSEKEKQISNDVRLYGHRLLTNPIDVCEQFRFLSTCCCRSPFLPPETGSHDTFNVR